MLLTNRRRTYDTNQRRQFALENCCSECGRPFEQSLPGKPFVLEGQTFKYGDFAVHLSQREVTLLSYLIKTYPKVCAREPVFEHIWGEHAELKVLDVYICKMRKKLRHSPVSIETEWGLGYRLKVTE